METVKIQVTCNPFGSSWVHEKFKTVKKPSQEYQMKRMSFSASILAIASIFAYGEKHSVPYDREIRLSSSYRPSLVFCAHNPLVKLNTRLFSQLMLNVRAKLQSLAMTWPLAYCTTLV